jgi:hypothetical protein
LVESKLTDEPIKIITGKGRKKYKQTYPAIHSNAADNIGLQAHSRCTK